MTATMPLTLEQIRIRPYTPADAPAVYAAVEESAAHVAPWMPGIQAGLPLAAYSAWIAASQAAWVAGTAYEFAIVAAGDDAILGACGLTQLHPYHRFANLYYWVRTSRLGQGVAPAAVRLAARYGMTTLGLQRIEIVVDVANTASARGGEAGAVQEGVLRNRVSYATGNHAAIMFSLIPEDFAEGR